MSYNIDHIEPLVLDAWMHAKDILDLHDNHDDWLPEGNFVEHHIKEATAALSAAAKCRACDAKNDLDASFCKKCAAALVPERPEAMRIKLKNFWFYGEGSGRCFTHMIADIGPRVMGTVEAVLTWEGGDTTSGLLIKDGKVCECGVEMKVVKPKGW